MSHKYKCGSLFFCRIQAVKSSCLYSFCCNCFCNSCFILIDRCFIRSDFTEKWFCNFYRFKFIFVVLNCFCQFIILGTMHQMCRLYDQVLNPVVDCSFQCLIHIVDLLIITGLYMVDDDLCCKCSSYRPVRICCLKCFFHTTDILCTAVIERCTKAYNQNFIFSDVIFVQRIIFRCIACIPSKIIRISVLAFYQFFLCISKLIPGFFCSLTLFICLVCSFLYINVIDQLCYFICRLLIAVFGCFFCLCRRSVLCLLASTSSHHRHRKCCCQ